MTLSDVNGAEQLQLERKPWVFGRIPYNTAAHLALTGKRSGKQSSTDKSIDIIGMYKSVYASAVLE